MTAAPVSQDVVKHTPSVAELLPGYAIEKVCQEPDCGMSFRNGGQFNFHMIRHHRKVIPKCAKVIYYCPVEKCIFHKDRLGGRSCSKMSLIRQHYQKVHVEKEYMCEKCGKKFLKIADLNRHQANESCEEIWQCEECGWKYSSREALLTHGRRKRHIIGIEVRSRAMKTDRKSSQTVVTPQQVPDAKQICVVLPNINKGNIELNDKNRPTPGEMTELDEGKIFCDIETPKGPTFVVESRFVGQIVTTQTSFSKLGLEKTESEERQTQTPTPTVNAVSVQTINECQTFFNVNNQVNEVLLSQDDITKLLCHNETQTESQQSSNSLGSTSTHMYTQTCNELMEALGLNIDVEVNVDPATLENAQTLSILPLSMLEDYVISTATQTNMEPMSSSNCDIMMPETSDYTSRIMNWPTSLVEDLRVSTATQTKFEQYFLSTQLGLVDIETQTMDEDVDMTANTSNPTTNTNCLSAIAITDDYLVSTETQTSFTQCLLDNDNFLNDIDSETTTPESPDLSSVANCLRTDDFLVSTETQTSYDQCLLASELILTDIETQTNWSFNDQSSQTFDPSLIIDTTTTESLNLFNDKATTVTDVDFLVSTETQTNFTSCLINNLTTSSNYDGLYMTQCTQTCDELLQELFFGGQDNLQCSYTQT